MGVPPLRVGFPAPVALIYFLFRKRTFFGEINQPTEFLAVKFYVFREDGFNYFARLREAEDKA